MTDATGATRATRLPAFVTVSLCGEDGSITEHLATVVTVRNAAPGVIVWVHADVAVKIGPATIEVIPGWNPVFDDDSWFWIVTNGLDHRSVAEELEHRWPDASRGVLRIAETLFADGWGLGLDDLHDAALALDDEPGGTGVGRHG